MPHIPEKKEIRGRIKLRNWIVGIGLVCLFFAVAVASDGNSKAFLFWIVPAGGFLLVGSKIKTHKHLRSYGGSYR